MLQTDIWLIEAARAERLALALTVAADQQRLFDLAAECRICARDAKPKDLDQIGRSRQKPVATNLGE